MHNPGFPDLLKFRYIGPLIRTSKQQTERLFPGDHVNITNRVSHQGDELWVVDASDIDGFPICNLLTTIFLHLVLPHLFFQLFLSIALSFLCPPCFFVLFLSFTSLSFAYLFVFPLPNPPPPPLSLRSLNF